jgi:CBS domain-containing protein
VVPEQEMLGDVADGRRSVRMAADGQQELVLGRRDPGVEGLLLAPVHEPSQPDTLSDALELMLEEEVEHLPVLDDGKLVGIFTRTDIVRARDAQRVHERTQPGWRPRRARS